MPSCTPQPTSPTLAAARQGSDTSDGPELPAQGAVAIAAPAADSRQDEPSHPYNQSAERTTRSRSLLGWPIVQRLSRDALFFLDSSDLKDLATLLDSVKASANLVLLLSRETLERPYILAELCVAYQAGVNICVVLVEFTARELDSRAFRFPAYLEKAIEEVSWYILQKGGNQKKSRGRNSVHSVSARSHQISRRIVGELRAARAGTSSWAGVPGLIRWRNCNVNRGPSADCGDLQPSCSSVSS